MAKSSSFFGLRRGSTKSLTFQVLDGKQITKDRVYEVRNPNTEKQRIQRVIMLTALRAYSAMQSICDHSWQGVSYGGKTQQAFMSANLKAIRERLVEAGQAYAGQKAFTPVGMTNLSSNKYIVSKGTLPTIDAAMGNTLELPCLATYAEVISLIGAEPGDQLTIMAIADAIDPSNVAFHYCRIILQPQDGTGANMDLTTPFLDEDGHINAPNLRNEGTDLFVFDYQDGIKAEVTYNGNPIVAGTAILSRYENGAWKRSTQQMVAKAARTGYTLAQAIDLSNNMIEVDDPYYLNGASDAQTEVYAEIESIKVNGNELGDGDELTDTQVLSITGTGLSRGSVVVTCDGRVFVPATSTGSLMTFNLQTNGNYQIRVNGTLWASFKVTGIVKPTNITSIQWGSEAPSTQFPLNRTIYIDQSVTLTIKGSGLEDAVMSVSNNVLTTVTPSVSEDTITYRIRGARVGDSQVLLNGTLLFAVSSMYDPNDDDSPFDGGM